jgi:hypothetical protein
MKIVKDGDQVNKLKVLVSNSKREACQFCIFQHLRLDLGIHLWCAQIKQTMSKVI